MEYRLSDIAAIVGGTLHGDASEGSIAHVLIDSRRLRSPENTLFVALVGDRHNGHNYVAELAKKGVWAFLVSEAQQLPAGKLQIVVPNTLKALQTLAAHHRQQFNICLLYTSPSPRDA